MASRPRRNHAPAFKAQVALAALKGDKTLADRHSAFTRKAPLIQGVSLSKQSEPPLGTGLGARRQVVEQVGKGRASGEHGRPGPSCGPACAGHRARRAGNPGHLLQEVQGYSSVDLGA